jgi:16S rRNA (uracil1498-N3)-methyltransferase
VRINPLREGMVQVAPTVAHHLARVLRVRVGAAVVAFDGDGREASGSVVRVDGDGVWLTLAQARVTEGGTAAGAAGGAAGLSIAAALIKGDRWEVIVRMGTELGAAAFVPIVTERSDVRELSPARRVRYERIAEESARQSGRARVPAIHAAVDLDELRWPGGAIVADPRAVTPLAAAFAGGGEWMAITGPEGGLTEGEVARLAARGARPVRLAPFILRADTAPVAIAAAWALGGGS